MNTSPIIAAIDAEIATLQEARKLLSGSPDLLATTLKRGRGRPKGSTNAKGAPKTANGKRTLSAEGRAKIAAAQKARWAAHKKAA